jgi:ComF family protein
MERVKGKGLKKSIDLPFHSALGKWIGSGLDLIFPPKCVGCGQSGTDWCASCQRAINVIVGPLCNRCGFPLNDRNHDRHLCASFPGMLKIRSYAWYDGPIKRALLHLKYRPNRRVADLMGRWLAGVVRKEGWEGTKVLAVPLGKKRIRQRGYNQADLIAEGLAKYLDLEWGKGSLVRMRETRSQVGLDPIARHLNVQGAFRADPADVEGEEIYLVDDLLTTGATLRACSEALLNAGARKIYGLTVARA